MRQQYADSYITKFDRPFTAFLHELSLSGGCDDEFGSVDEFGSWVGRLGRHVLIEDSNGAVYSFRVLSSATGPAFYAWADEYFGAEAMRDYMNGDED